ncbi:MAG: DUF87 domain-containing protein [Candidatus Altiarchaeales archaeon]|nr:DUF87 domain-containing protein [Candidatus Altiarchaeales archaeon]
MVMELGTVIGSTTLRGFRFVIKDGREEHVKRDEFVVVQESVTANKILGVVKDIVVSNELLPEEFSRELRMSDLLLKEGEYPVPIVKTLGINEAGTLELPRHGIQPGSPVWLAEDKDLKALLELPQRRAAKIGSLATRKSIEVGVDLNELVSRHCAVLAMTGAGKSYTVGVLLEELMKKNGSVVVFDLHNEFTNMDFEGAETKIYSTERNQKTGDLLRIDASSLSLYDFMSLLPDITTTQQDLLDELLNLTKRFYDQYDLSTLLKTLSILYDVKKSGKKKEDTVFPGDHLKSMTRKVGLSTIGALMRRIKRIQRIGIFTLEGTGLDELVSPNQLTIVNLSESDEHISEIVVAAVSRKIFHARKKHLKDRQSGLKTPTFLVLEEAHNFAPASADGMHSISRSILRKIAREGRKFGVGVCLVSQRPNKLDSDILSQCNTQFIMKIVNPADQDHIRQSVESVTEDVVRDLPALARGEAVVAGSAIRFPVTVKIRKRETHVGGQDIDIISAWNALTKKNGGGGR